MSRIGFQEASSKRISFLALTGLDVTEFNKLKPFFEEAFLHRMKMFTVEGKERGKRAFVDYDNASLSTIEDKLLFVLIFVKQNLTQEVMAFMFGMSQSKVHEWLQTLIPVLKQSLYLSKDLPGKTKEQFMDAVKNIKDPLFVTTAPKDQLKDL